MPLGRPRRGGYGGAMQPMVPALAALIKRALPTSLFGRALLILVVPTLFVQILAITIFYDRHWRSIQRHLSSSLAGEIAVVASEAARVPPEERLAAVADYGELMQMNIRLIPSTRCGAILRIRSW